MVKEGLGGREVNEIPTLEKKSTKEPANPSNLQGIFRKRKAISRRGGGEDS